MRHSRKLSVWLDDERPPPSSDWVVATTSQDAILLLRTGQVLRISLDHDLGDDIHGTGYDALAWLEREVVERGFVPPDIRVHTANPPARNRMLASVEAIERLVATSQIDPDTPERRLAALPPGYVESVVAKCHEALGDALQEVILYGSRAYGRPTPDSDVDIALIVTKKVWLNDKKSEFKLARDIGSFAQFDLYTQIYVETRQEIESYRNVSISMQAHILECGIKLYVSDRVPAPEKVVEPKSPLSIANAWLKRAEYQIQTASEGVAAHQTAGLALSPNDTQLYLLAACWSLKAVLFARGISCVDRKLRWNLVRLQRLAALFEPGFTLLGTAITALPWPYDQDRYGIHDQPEDPKRSQEECQAAFAAAWSIYAKCVKAVERLAAVPQYEADDGPLTDEQHTAIDRAVQSTVGSARITQSLFTDASEIDETRGPQSKTEGDQSVLSREILRLADISAATRAYLLSQGPILYVDEAQFPGEIVREWPDGRREIVRRNNDGELVVVRTITNKSSKES